MKIIVVGCGKIGTAVVSTLLKEGHDLTVVDNNPAVINEMTNIYDIMGLCGNGADCDALKEAGAENADLLIATTHSDEFNMLSCFLSKKIGTKNTVARIRNPEYHDKSLGFMRQQLELSMSINPELLMAQELYNILKFPSAYKIEYFARRNLEMIELRLKPEDPLCGKKLSKLREKQKNEFLISAVLRQGQVIIPDGNFELQASDVISIMANPGDIQKLLKNMGMLKKQSRNIMILGGSTTAYYLGKMLLSSGNNVKIVEKNTDRCQNLADSLPKITMINGDGSHHELLLEEGLRSLDALVALTGSDETNILISFFAANQEVPQVIPKVNRSELSSIAEKFGIDCVVSTKSVVSDIVLRYTRALENSQGSNVETLYKIMDGKAEAIEFIAKGSSSVIGTPLKSLKFKQGILIAGIIRGGKRGVIPSGDDCINEGDRVIVIAADHILRDLSDILQR